MKRGRSLVDYDSSDEEQENSLRLKNHKLAASKENTGRHGARRRLPELPSELLGNVRIDNPSLHQGRRRSTPHTEGQFAAYVYVPVVVERNSELWKLLREIIIKTKGIVPALQSDNFRFGIGTGLQIGEEDKNDDTFELHISLTRPVYLWRYQLEELRRAVKAAAHGQSRFSASFSAFVSLENDEHSRIFLGVEIGAGHEQFSKITSSLNSALRLLHQKEFYTEPRYHASFAWALLDPPSSPEVAQLNENSKVEYLTIPRFPTTLVLELNRDFVPKLVAHGIFEVERVKLKIGKNVSSWSLKT